jgi:hypothetical protein
MFFFRKKKSLPRYSNPLKSKKVRPSFLKKRSKKLLCLQVGAGERSATAIKSFLLLFFKKEDPSCPRPMPPIAARGTQLI